jgi:glucosamine-6-phosphate deaminase
MSTQPLQTTQIDDLLVSVYASNEELGAAAAVEAAEIIGAAVAARGVANIIIATGNSQLTFLAALRAWPGVPWEAVNVFHMDEYVNLPPGHPASFPAF